jgi:flagellar motor switch protein FliG
MAARVGGKKRLTGTHRVAVLLRLLDEEVATEILKHLDDRDIARIHRADTDLGDPSPDLLKDVAQEIRTRLTGGGGTGVAKIQRKRIEHLLERIFDQERLTNIFGRTDTEVTKLHDTLADIDPRVIGRILSREYPQTSALVLSQLPRLQGSEVLLSLPDEYRVEVMMRLARLDQISEEMLRELSLALKRELAGFEGGMQAQEMVGIDHAVQIFSKLDRGNEASLMEGIAEQDEEVAQHIRERMFVFEDLLEVDDRGIQTLLRNVENRTLVLALRGAAEELKDKFLRNVSQRVASAILEDLDALGPVRLSEVEKAQQEIANSARELQERGEIVGGGRDDDVVV